MDFKKLIEIVKHQANTEAVKVTRTYDQTTIIMSKMSKRSGRKRWIGRKSREIK